jgi:deoxyribodipyrimidine photolyase-related protein
MFVDSIDWVTLPNAPDMAMHANRRKGAAKGVTGRVGTKPYAASGTYIERRSNGCTGCRYEPAERSGPSACPFTVPCWSVPIRTQIAIDAEMLRRRLGISRNVRGEHS